MNWLIPLYMGLVSRWHGSEIRTPKSLEAFFYMLPVGWLLHEALVNPWLIALAIILGIVFKNTGHADGFQDYERDQPLTPIAVFIALFFKVERESKAYDFIFWTIKGALMMLLPAILLGSFWVFLFSALGYSIAYYLGFNWLGMRGRCIEESLEAGTRRKIFKIDTRLPLPNMLYFPPTVWGEFLGGFFTGLGFLFI